MINDIRRLITTIETGTMEETWEAAKELSSIGTETVLLLISLLTKAKRADARAAAAYVLGTNRYESARASLEELLSNPNEEPLVRGHAAEALGYIQNPKSVRVLLEQLRDQNPGVKYWCIFALGLIKDREAVPALKLITESREDECYDNHSLRREALNAIDEIARGTK
jgi:HEAT repeat protein